MRELARAGPRADGRLQGPLRLGGRRHRHARRDVPRGDRSVPGGAARGPARPAGDRRACSSPSATACPSTPRSTRVADITTRDDQRQAVADRRPAAAVRDLRALRGERDRDVRRRDGRARHRARPGRAARVAVPPGRRQRRRAVGVQRPGARGRPAVEPARALRRSRPASAGADARSGRPSRPRLRNRRSARSGRHGQSAASRGAGALRPPGMSSSSACAAASRSVSRPRAVSPRSTSSSPSRASAIVARGRAPIRRFSVIARRRRSSASSGRPSAWASRASEVLDGADADAAAGDDGEQPGVRLELAYSSSAASRSPSSVGGLGDVGQHVPVQAGRAASRRRRPSVRAAPPARGPRGR